MAAKRSRRRTSSGKGRGSAKGSLTPWYGAALLAIGGIVAYDHWPALKPELAAGEHVAATTLAAHMPAEKPKAVAALAVRPHQSAMPVPPMPVPQTSVAQMSVPPASIPVIPVSAPRPQAPPAPATSKESFGFCGDGPHFNCVVDGDTFWVRGAKIRIADIEAPPVDTAACAQEKSRGTAAKLRLLSLLNQGAFTLEPNGPDTDKDGMKLRTLYRQGHSIGMQMVSEGLAQPSGSRRSWCM